MRVQVWDLLGASDCGQVCFDVETCVDVIGFENENETEGVRERKWVSLF